MSGCKFYNTIQYNTIQYNTIQYNTIQYNTIQYKPLLYNWLFFHCKNKKLLWTFKRFLWRELLLAIEVITL